MCHCNAGLDTLSHGVLLPIDGPSQAKPLNFPKAAGGQQPLVGQGGAAKNCVEGLAYFKILLHLGVGKVGLVPMRCFPFSWSQLKLCSFSKSYTPKHTQCLLLDLGMRGMVSLSTVCVTSCWVPTWATHKMSVK